MPAPHRCRVFSDSEQGRPTRVSAAVLGGSKGGCFRTRGKATPPASVRRCCQWGCSWTRSNADPPASVQRCWAAARGMLPCERACHAASHLHQHSDHVPAGPARLSKTVTDEALAPVSRLATTASTNGWRAQQGQQLHEVGKHLCGHSTRDSQIQSVSGARARWVQRKVRGTTTPRLHASCFAELVSRLDERVTSYPARERPVTRGEHCAHSILPCLKNCNAREAFRPCIVKD